MRSLFLFFTLCLALLAAPVAAQEPADEYRGFYNMEPMARFGFGTPYDATFMPDGESFAIATGAGVTFYDLAFNETQHINTWDHVPGVIAVSPDGRTLATGGGDVRLWDVETGTLLDILPAGRGIGGLAFSADGKRLAVSKGWGAAEDGLGIYIFDVSSGRQQTHLATNAIFTQIAFHPDGGHLVARRVYDCCGSIVIIGMEEVTLPSIFNPEAEAFVVTPDGEDLLVFMQGLGWVKQGTDETDESVGRYRSVRAVSPITADGTFTAVMDDGEVAVWDSKTLQQTESFSLDIAPYVISIAAISPDGRHIIAVSERVWLVDMQTRQVETRDYVLPRIGLMVVGGDDVFYVAPDFQIGWWNIWTDDFGFLNGHQGNINALVASDDGRLYSGSDDGTIRRWSTAEKDSESTVLFEQPDARVTALTLSRDNQLFAVVCERDHGLLFRFDGTSGESLGFFSDADAAAPTLPAIELQDCDITLGPIIESYTNSPGRLSYTDQYSIYTLDKLNASTITRETPPIRFHKLYFAGNPYANTFVYRGLAFMWDPMEGMYVKLTHNFDITAFAQPSDSLFASSACAEQADSRDGAFCFGVDMALSDDIGRNARETLIGHSQIVREILVHPTLPLLISLSEDGTIILWGSPREPQPFRRAGGLGRAD
jgi:WD40 repeat protein